MARSGPPEPHRRGDCAGGLHQHVGGPLWRAGPHHHGQGSSVHLWHLGGLVQEAESPAHHHHSISPSGQWYGGVDPPHAALCAAASSPPGRTTCHGCCWACRLPPGRRWEYRRRRRHCSSNWWCLVSYRRPVSGQTVRWRPPTRGQPRRASTTSVASPALLKRPGGPV